jgi:hypothetical protein
MSEIKERVLLGIIRSDINKDQLFHGYNMGKLFLLKHTNKIANGDFGKLEIEFRNKYNNNLTVTGYVIGDFLKHIENCPVDTILSEHYLDVDNIQKWKTIYRLYEAYKIYSDKDEDYWIHQRLETDISNLLGDIWNSI